MVVKYILANCHCDCKKVGVNDFVDILHGLGAAVLYTTVIFLNKRLKDITGIESSNLFMVRLTSPS